MRKLYLTLAVSAMIGLAVFIGYTIKTGFMDSSSKKIIVGQAVNTQVEEDKQTDSIATMQEINEWCASQEAENVVDNFLTTYSGVFGEMNMYSSADGVLTYTYQYINQQEYDMDQDQLNEQQVANYKAEDQMKQIQDGFSDFLSKGLKLTTFEYIYYNADGTVITDVVCSADGTVEAK